MISIKIFFNILIYREAKNQVKICSKEIKAAAFRDAIACEQTKSIFEQFNLDDYSIYIYIYI